MLAGSTIGIAIVVMSMMPAVSASNVRYCCANRTDGVPVGIVLATNVACAIVPVRPASLIMQKNKAGWTTRQTREPRTTCIHVNFKGCSARARPPAKIATPAAETAKGDRAKNTYGESGNPDSAKAAPSTGHHTRGLAAERSIAVKADGAGTAFNVTDPEDSVELLPTLRADPLLEAAALCKRYTATETCARFVTSAASPTIPVPTPCP